MESVVIGLSDANPQNVLIDTIQVDFVSCISIQNWFHLLASPISANGIVFTKQLKYHLRVILHFFLYFYASHLIY